MNLPADVAAVLRRIAEIEQLPPAGAQPHAATFQANVDRLIEASSAKWSLDPALVKAIVANESGFDPHAISATGAQGLMQLEPETAAELGVSDPFDPAQNVNGGARYIRGLLDRFHGDLRLALAAYNAGPGAVQKYGGLPPYAETRAYVDNVMASYRRYQTQR